jgi:hypothetical protein
MEKRTREAKGVISAVCTGCGRLARDERYSSESPEGDTLFWASDCTHDYEFMEVITCRCGMRCPYCQTPQERHEQRAMLRGKDDGR